MPNAKPPLQDPEQGQWVVHFMLAWVLVGVGRLLESKPNKVIKGGIGGGFVLLGETVRGVQEVRERVLLSVV